MHSITYQGSYVARGATLAAIGTTCERFARNKPTWVTDCESGTFWVPRSPSSALDLSRTAMAGNYLQPLAGGPNRLRGRAPGHTRSLVCIFHHCRSLATDCRPLQGGAGGCSTRLVMSGVVFGGGSSNRRRITAGRQRKTSQIPVSKQLFAIGPI